ncbi:MAG: class I SAM-dependent methyltransferase [Bacteroidota bacterium]|nr:class I SAM-dependent methyltransferase [Bacteroidota bacterium]
MPNPTPTSLHANKKAVPKAFNAVAVSYDLATAMSQGYQEDLNRSAAALHLQGYEYVLDLCCGTGKSTKACMQYLSTGKITGIDNSEGMLEVARKKFSKEISAGLADFSLQDAMHLQLDDNTFDAVFVAYGLRNMPDYDKFIKSLYRILKPGGKLCIHDYSIKNTAWAKWYWLILGYGFVVPFCAVVSRSSIIFRYLIKSVADFLNPVEIIALLKNNGFENAQVIKHKSWREPILHTFVAQKPTPATP